MKASGDLVVDFQIYLYILISKLFACNHRIRESNFFKKKRSKIKFIWNSKLRVGIITTLIGI